MPWELLHPVDGDKNFGFIGETLPVLRKVYDLPPCDQLDLGEAAFVVPPNSPSDAHSEVIDIREKLGLTGGDDIKHTLTEVIDLLQRPPGVLHFACHNSFAADRGSKVVFDDGPFTPDDLEVVRAARSLLPRRPLVFFNACRSAGEIYGFTHMSGWASEFMSAGASGFVGTLWPVRSPAARSFANAFYTALRRHGSTLADAALAARKAISSDNGDPTWLAYTVYGSPAATYETA